MTIDEKIEKLETQIFYLDMKDHWSNEDFETSHRWHEELRKLRKEKEGN